MQHMAETGLLVKIRHSRKATVSNFSFLAIVSTACLNRFLLEVSTRHPNEHIIMVMDGAASHRSNPLNISLLHLPPYSPELNAVENFWKMLRASSFYNRVFKTLDEVEELLMKQLKHFEDNRHRVASTVGVQWILNALVS